MSEGRKTVRFQMIMNEELDTRLADWRRVQPDLPNRNEAIRRLIEQALEVAEIERNENT